MMIKFRKSFFRTAGFLGALCATAAAPSLAKLCAPMAAPGEAALRP